ncbi:capsule biosynthesis protein [Pontitalea aquivivens]|uniref:capsule biosynthesis protein n=1 Tax=Pontitalea aquivivens TaxID=3388663 RepID=UPI003970F8E6
MKKYRIRRDSDAPATAHPPAGDAGAGAESLFDTQDDGFGEGRFATAATGTVTPAQDLASDAELAQIRAEGLTGRQLRLARRVALKHGLAATSDLDAVRLLRRRGIDPFDRAQLLRIIGDGGPDEAEAAAEIAAQGADMAQGAKAGGPAAKSLARLTGQGARNQDKLPQTVRPGTNMPSREVLDEGTRARGIIRIQRDIARRRRRRLAMLMARLTFFVFLPTLLAGLYYFMWATPLYATKTEFVIQKADGAGGGLGGLFSGTQLATSQDSITVQSFLQSRDAMMRLDGDLGFKAHFSQDGIDPLLRLPPGATNERAYKLYRDMVLIGYDPTEGIVRMEVVAADPGLSRRFSEALIDYAEEQVDSLTARLRGDQMKGARDSYADAEQKVLDAQARVLALQEQLGVLDPATETSVVMTQIGTFETQLRQKRLELQQLTDNPRPNRARVEGVQGDIARLEAMIAELRASLTQANGSGTSLAAVSGQLRIAEADLLTRQQMLSAAAQQLETARVEANKQVRYLEMGVRPVAPDEPTYPRAFENTLLAFLIFSGIYLMLSLTVSILREQVSS